MAFDYKAMFSITRLHVVMACAWDVAGFGLQGLAVGLEFSMGTFRNFFRKIFSEKISRKKILKIISGEMSESTH